MHLLLMAMLIVALSLCGCAGNKVGAPVDSYASPMTPKLIVSPDTSLVGKVAMVNQSGRFVVLNFPLGRLPGPDQHFNLYRGGFKVGEVRITGPQHDDNVVADLLLGESQVGDEARND